MRCKRPLNDFQNDSSLSVFFFLHLCYRVSTCVIRESNYSIFRVLTYDLFFIALQNRKQTREMYYFLLTWTRVMLEAWDKDCFSCFEGYGLSRWVSIHSFKGRAISWSVCLFRRTRPCSGNLKNMFIYGQKSNNNFFQF